MARELNSCFIYKMSLFSFLTQSFSVLRWCQRCSKSFSAWQDYNSGKSPQCLKHGQIFKKLNNGHLQLQHKNICIDLQKNTCQLHTEQSFCVLLMDIRHQADGVHFGAAGDRLPAFSGLTWQSLAVLQRSCTRDWNENKAEWLLSDVWYMTCNGMFPELPLHMAAYSPPDLDWTASENNSELFVLTWLQSRSGGSSRHLDIAEVVKINRRKYLLIPFDPKLQWGAKSEKETHLGLNTHTHTTMKY